MANPLLLAAALLPPLATYPIAVLQDGAPGAATIEIVHTGRDIYNRATVPVRIDDKGPYRFIIDTGAERTVLSRTVAHALGLAPRAQGTLVGVAGSQAVDIVAVEELALGRRSYFGLATPLLEADNIGAEGIVGLDSLQGQRVLIDFAKNRMAVGDAQTLGGNGGFEIVVTARRRSGQLIMTNALVDGIRTDVIIDTGAETSIGNRALQEAMRRRHAGQQTRLLSVTGQEITADLATARRIEIDRLTLANTTIAFADSPPFERLGLARKPALMLGMSQLRLFRRVAIDFATRKVLFDMPETAELPPASWERRSGRPL